MSFKEIIYFRVPQFIQHKILGRLQIRRTLKPLSLSANFKSPNYSIEAIKKVFQEEISLSTYPLFNHSIDLFTVDSWRKDYINHIESPQKYYANIERQNFKLVGDVKIVAELSRMHFLPIMALKSRLDQDQEYLNFIYTSIIEWNNQNPYLNSIHWTSGIEVAIRSINLIYTHQILKESKMLSNTAEVSLNAVLTNSYDFLKHHLSFYSSANNHLMAELMGLIALSTYFDCSKEKKAHWIALFFDQVKQQINQDGVHMELCTRYHAEVTEQIMITIEFLERAGDKIPQRIYDTTKKLFEFIHHVEFEGNETIFGDNDEGGVIYPYHDNKFSIYTSLLNASNYKFKTSYTSNGITDARNLIVYGDDFKIEEEKKSDPVDSLFDASGYMFAYDHESKAKISFDCGTVGDHISAAHGHSDIFHINFSLRGKDFLVDCGTYQYHKRFKFWRDYFKGINAHNTVSIEKHHHAVNNGRMSWINLPQTTVNKYESSVSTTTCSALTNAFEAKGIKHERRLDFDKKKKKLTITDFFQTKSNKDTLKKFEYYLHFHPQVKISKNKDVVILQNESQHIQLTANWIDQAKIIKADSKQPLGWYSNTYNEKQPAHTLIYSSHIADLKEHKIELILTYS